MIIHRTNETLMTLLPSGGRSCYHSGDENNKIHFSSVCIHCAKSLLSNRLYAANWMLLWPLVLFWGCTLEAWIIFVFLFYKYIYESRTVEFYANILMNAVPVVFEMPNKWINKQWFVLNEAFVKKNELIHFVFTYMLLRYKYETEDAQYT